MLQSKYLEIRLRLNEKLSVNAKYEAKINERKENLFSNFNNQQGVCATENALKY